MRDTFSLTQPLAAIAENLKFPVAATHRWAPSKTFVPESTILIVRKPIAVRSLSPEVVTATWGFVPVWHQGEMQPIPSVDFVRAQTNGIFESALRARRCLIILDQDPNLSGAGNNAATVPTLSVALGVFSTRHFDKAERVSAAFLTAGSSNDSEDKGLMSLEMRFWEAWLDPKLPYDASTLGP